MARLFVGIPLSDELRASVLAWQNARRAWPVRWIPPENLHVTLVPPWEEKDPTTPLAKLRKIEGAISSFVLEFETITFGPSSRAPRLIWASGKASRGFETCVTQTHAVLGFPPPRRETFLHVTLARFRPEIFGSFPVRELDEHVEWMMRAEKIVIYRSHLLPGGARYEAQGVIPARGKIMLPPQTKE